MPVNPKIAGHLAQRLQLHVRRNPGVSRSALWRHFHPFLTAAEVNLLLADLVNGGILKLDSFDCFHSL